MSATMLGATMRSARTGRELARVKVDTMLLEMKVGSHSFTQWFFQITGLDQRLQMLLFTERETFLPEEALMQSMVTINLSGIKPSSEPIR
jgi:hypothetical protein